MALSSQTSRKCCWQPFQPEFVHDCSSSHTLARTHAHTYVYPAVPPSLSSHVSLRVSGCVCECLRLYVRERVCAPCSAAPRACALVSARDGADKRHRKLALRASRNKSVQVRS